MSKKTGIGGFIFGAVIGAGLGLLFAPRSGKATRKALKTKLEELTEQIKNIDVEELKKEFTRKVEDIKMDLVDLDKEKAMEIASEKAAVLKTKAQDLANLAKDKGTPVLKKTANDVLDKVIKISKDTQKKIANK